MMDRQEVRVITVLSAVLSAVVFCGGFLYFGSFASELGDLLLIDSRSGSYFGQPWCGQVVLHYASLACS